MVCTVARPCVGAASLSLPAVSLLFVEVFSFLYFTSTLAVLHLRCGRWTGSEGSSRATHAGVIRAPYARAQADPNVRSAVTRRCHSLFWEQGQLYHALGRGNWEAYNNAPPVAQASRRQSACCESPQQRSEGGSKSMSWDTRPKDHRPAEDVDAILCSCCAQSCSLAVASDSLDTMLDVVLDRSGTRASCWCNARRFLPSLQAAMADTWHQVDGIA